MPVDTDLFGSCGLRFESEVFSDGAYSLSRVDFQGRKLLAEVSDTSGVYQHRWPSVGGLIQPVSSRDLPGQQKLVLFDIGTDIILFERINTVGRFTLEKALDITGMALGIVSDLQAAGLICGYIGPEMFVLHGSSILMLAGRRGIPESPFTAPEVQSSRPSDPRSDVSAMGSFLFRLVAGTDKREKQLQIWQELSPGMQTAIQDMVAVSPVNRPNSLKAVKAILSNLAMKENEEADEEPIDSSQAFVKQQERAASTGSKKKLFWILGSVAIIVLGYFAITSSALPLDPDPDLDHETEIVPAEETPEEEVEVVSPWVDSLSEEETILPDVSAPLEDSAIVWISNSSGVPDLEQSFRAGSVSSYSYVYPLTGTTNRQSSLILARRSDPSVPLREMPLGQEVYQIADTSFVVKSVDLTILLGTDLNYSGINSQFLHQPVAPAGTLFVDIVNHGIQYSLDGMGAATWTADRIEGKACNIEGTEWLISVIDIRDADRFSEEIGIPEVLDETLFLFKPDNLQAGTLETLLRQYFQPLPNSADFSLEAIPISDIHILIGSTFQD